MQGNGSSVRPATPILMATIVILIAAASCGTPKTPPQTGPSKESETSTTTDRGGEPPAALSSLATTPIAQLAPDQAREVRVAGVIEQILGMRLVPAQIIFKIRDNTGSVSALLEEKAELTEGQRIEIVGRYKTIPSPMHQGPGAAPEEPLFVVDRYIAF